MTDIRESKQLVDIRNVYVDRSLPKQERIDEYIHQIKDPYNFKCGKFTVRARYAEGSPTLDDCLKSIMN